MPGNRPYKKPVSAAQARFFGAAAGGQIPGFDPKEAQHIGYLLGRERVLRRRLPGFTVLPWVVREALPALAQKGRSSRQKAEGSTGPRCLQVWA